MRPAAFCGVRQKLTRTHSVPGSELFDKLLPRISPDVRRYSSRPPTISNESRGNAPTLLSIDQEAYDRITRCDD